MRAPSCQREYFLDVLKTGAAAKSLQSCPTLCDPIDGSPPGSTVPGILQAEHWGGLPFPSPMHESEVAQSYPTLRDPMDCSPPGSSAPGIFQARVVEWGAIAFSKLFSRFKLDFEKQNSSMSILLRLTGKIPSASVLCVCVCCVSWPLAGLAAYPPTHQGILLRVPNVLIWGPCGL